MLWMKSSGKAPVTFRPASATTRGSDAGTLCEAFSIERYQALYELRAKSKNLVRIIFTLTDSGDILFLVPFIKRHKRNTMQALERSLDYLAHIKDGSCSIQELSIKFFLNGGITV